MKKILLIPLLLAASAYGQCTGCLVSTRVGLKGGVTVCTYLPADGSGEFRGTGAHFGFGMGTDILKLIALDVTPQYQGTNYSRQETFFERTYSYKNIYFPVSVSLKAGMLPLISPYLSIGLGFNLIVSGYEIHKYANGNITQTPLSGSNASAYLILGLGAEVKLLKLRITPEFTAHIQPKPENDPNAAQTIDYHISLGLYYAP
jgi:hypothetical protein